jgi:hypothetical protein
MGDFFTEGVCFDTSLARGKWGMVGLAIPIFCEDQRGLSAQRFKG